MSIKMNSNTGIINLGDVKNLKEIENSNSSLSLKTKNNGIVNIPRKSKEIDEVIDFYSGHINNAINIYQQGLNNAIDNYQQGFNKAINNYANEVSDAYKELLNDITQKNISKRETEEKQIIKPTLKEKIFNFFRF